MLKRPYTIDEQITQLNTHKIVVKDEEYAKKILSRINYYRLTGYALQFRKSPSDSDCVEGVTFELIVNLYMFDEELRCMLRKYLEIVEVYYKATISHYFSLQKCSVSPYDQHYDEHNFYNKKGYQYIVANFKAQKKYYQDSLILKHHQAKYSGKMPLWVIMELLSFSNASMLYSAMYYSEKDLIASKIGVSRQTLENHLHCLAVLRNKCAHGARLYNTTMSPKAHFPSAFLRKHVDVLEDSDFAYLLVLIKRLPSKAMKIELFDAICSLIKKYTGIIDFDLLGIPEDYIMILNNQI